MAEKHAGGSAPEPAASGSRYVVLAVVLAAVFMGVLDTNVVNVALPTITAAFGVELVRSQWIVTSYLVVNTALLLVFGRLSEYTGKVRLFMAGIAVFTVGSLACGLAPGLDLLILFRALQGLGASIVFSINTAILVQAFPVGERGRTLGMIGTTVAIASIAGPILGGYITGLAGWPYIFFINVPVGIVLLAVASRYLKLPEKPRRVQGMDWNGAVALVLTMVSLILLLGDLAGSAEPDTALLAYAGVFLASLAWFVSTELGHGSPIIDLRLFKVRKFSFASLSTLINFTAFSMFILCTPFLLQYAWGYTPRQIGTVLLAVPLVTGIAAPVSGYLYDRLQSTFHSSFGMLVSAVALFVLGFAAGGSNAPLLVAGLGLYGLGTGLFTSPNNTEIMSALPPDRSGTASSVLATVRNFGNVVGVSLASILLSLLLRSAGFDGVVSASAGDPGALAASIGLVFFAAGAACVAGVATSLAVGLGRQRGVRDGR